MHLRVALALWNYCVDSARHLFLSHLDDPNAEKLLCALRARPEGITRSEIFTEVFGGHLSRSKIAEALAYLRRLKLADFEPIETAGRPTHRWFAIVVGVEVDIE